MDKKIDTGIAKFKKGKCYRLKAMPKIVKKVHSKPRDIYGFPNLLVNARLPTQQGTYLVVLTTTQCANIDEWQEIPQELFDKTITGSLDARLDRGMTMESKLVTEDEVEAMTADLNEDLEMPVYDISDKPSDD